MNLVMITAMRMILMEVVSAVFAEVCFTKFISSMAYHFQVLAYYYLDMN